MAAHNGNANRDIYVRDPLPDQLPPHNLEAERKLLGGMMLDNGTIADVLEVLAREDLYRDSHQFLFDAIVAVHHSGLPADAIHVAEELIRMGRFDEIGGDELLGEVLNDVPHGANAKYHAEIVKQKAIARRLAEAALEDIRDTYSNRYTSEELVARREERQSRIEFLGAAGCKDDELPKYWPKPLGQAAYHGLLGEAMELIMPHTEADPAPTLLTMAAGLGNMVGRGPHMMLGGARHALKFFVAVIGNTATGRKGTSWEAARHVLESVSPEWVADNVKRGMASGEGMIVRIQDEISQEVDDPKALPGMPPKKKIIIAKGVADKRALWLESEFGGVLGMMNRDGSSLSQKVRQFWEGENVESSTKNAPVRTTGAHVSIVGHSTFEDLTNNLLSVDMANGFGNRFLWCVSRDSKNLPEGGMINQDSPKFRSVASRMNSAILGAMGEDRTPFVRDPSLREMWWELYPTLKLRPPGLLGALTQRAAPYVMRLACLYAMLDRTFVIQKEHMEAALEIWRYCEDSTRFIFGDRLGDSVAEKILKGLLESDNKALSASQIHSQVLKGRVKAEDRDKALYRLFRQGYVECEDPAESGQSKRTGGRMIWRLRALKSLDPRAKCAKYKSRAANPEPPAF